MLIKKQLVKAHQALPGRGTAPAILNAPHSVFDIQLDQAMLPGQQQAIFGLGCFWGAERKFWTQPGVMNTAVGYSAGFTPNPSYEEVCSGATGHNEVVKVVFDSAVITYETLLEIFWVAHNPTQGMAQGNDQGTQYRSGIYTFDDKQLDLAQAGKGHYQAKLSKAGYGAVTTEIQAAGPFYFAELYHQQYLDKNPGGYCGLGGVNVPY